WRTPSQAQKCVLFPGSLLPSATSLGSPKPGAVHRSQG
ncbi:hypothetical protein A2U01_0103451, partial [Trifolium medium]|nr:hypothetical protein [Trifolium medium]